MDDMKLLRALVVLSMILALVACGDDGVDTVTGVFVDSTVEGLGYECGSSTTRKFTNAAGEFTCDAGDEVRFYLGEILLGSVEVTRDTEVVTPVMLTGADLNDLTSFVYGDGELSEEASSSLAMSAILQALDSDGDPDNGITLDEDILASLDEAGDWDYSDESAQPVVDDILALLDDEEIEVPDVEEALEHLLENAEALLHGHYTASFTEEGDGEEEEDKDIRVDLFVFDNPSGGEGAPPGLQARLLVDDQESRRPYVVDVGAQLNDLEDVYLHFDFDVNGITVDVYDAEAIGLAQIEFPEEGEIDLSTLAPYLERTVVLTKLMSPPQGLKMSDIGAFFEQLEAGGDTPEGIDEDEYARVSFGATVPSPEIIEDGPLPASLYGTIWAQGRAQKLGYEGYFEQYDIVGGHLMLNSIGESRMVYTGRVLIEYYPDGGGIRIRGENPEPEGELVWSNVTVTIDVDGTVEVDLDGDEWDETMEIDYAEVSGSEQF